MIFSLFARSLKERRRGPAALLARSRPIFEKVALGFLCLSRLLDPIRESTRFALDAYSYLRYLRFSFFYKLVLSPLSCGILKIIPTDAHSYFRYLRFAVVCNLAVSPLSFDFCNELSIDFRFSRFCVFLSYFYLLNFIINFKQN